MQLWCNCALWSLSYKSYQVSSIYQELTGMKKDLSCDAFHHHPSHRSDGAPFRIIERALWMIQTGQGTDLVLGYSGLVGRLKGHRQTEKGKKKQQHKAVDLWDFKNNTLSGFVWKIHLCKYNEHKVSQKLHKGQVTQRTSHKVGKQLWRSAVVYMGDALISQQ